jgi:YHS domain-containing protein
LVKLLIWGLLLYIGYRIIISLTSSKKPASKLSEAREADTATYRDPVCGVYVSEEQAIVGTHGGQRHYFCSMDCLEKYREQLP